MTKYQNTLLKGGSTLMKGAGIFIAGTTVLDFAMTLKQREETRAQIKQQEEKLEEEKKKQNRNRRKMRRRSSINSDLAKDLVLDMFESRSGHHKMGNSKFRRT